METIIKPVLTEKMTKASEKHNRYGFIVNSNANKIEIKSAVEKAYSVNVEKVWTQNYIGKIKTRNTKRGPVSGLTNRHKKAVVSLKEGEVIDFYSNI
ncbi:MAG: 50S ribosomal protein L23 [Bacteroidia bacterium]|nr:50S ribosomal protein L23 [Bacteroidia bacterium]MCZ2247739.1 50S ribosomal protein L23 [Bacteroidia bacterium]